MADNNSWQNASFQNIEMTQNEKVIENNQIETSEENNNLSNENSNKLDETNKIINIVEVNDGYVKLDGGKFMMGSPNSENWRIDDELLHEVIVSPFYIDKYETTQKEYEELMNENDSEFKGKNLPVENINFIDAINFANAKSLKTVLKNNDVYHINNGNNEDLIIFLTKITQFETGLENFTNNDNIDVEIRIVKQIAGKSFNLMYNSFNNLFNVIIRNYFTYNNQPPF